jgi:hypothetical protein
MTEETKEPQSADQQPAQLSISDLAAMKSIIDTASARGTFKPSEMMIVGQTYNKLTAFLESVKAQSQGEKQ